MSKDLIQNYDKLNKFYAVFMVIFFISLISGIFLVTYTDGFLGPLAIGLASLSIITLFFLGIKRRKIRSMAREGIDSKAA